MHFWSALKITAGQKRLQSTKLKALMAEELRNWFRLHRRTLPWRLDRSPYSVWVSEVMLQQTQVAVVVPYFTRWMQRFPSVSCLASASMEEVLKLWEGLGYYSRARNLKVGATQVMERHGGRLPEDERQLRAIKGIGEYTAAAIRGFAFQRRAAAVDGNVLRVLSRLFGFSDDIARQSTRRKVADRLLDWLPSKAPWEVNEALIELGATVCTKQPACGMCPMRERCKAYEKGLQAELPVKSGRSVYEVLHRAVAVIRCSGKLLLQRRPSGQVMADLHEFPYFELNVPVLGGEQMLSLVHSHLAMAVTLERPMSETRHSFTRYRARLFPWLLGTDSCVAVNGFAWIDEEATGRLSFSAGHRKILQEVRKIGCGK